MSTSPGSKSNSALCYLGQALHTRLLCPCSPTQQCGKRACPLLGALCFYRGNLTLSPSQCPPCILQLPSPINPHDQDYVNLLLVERSRALAKIERTYCCDGWRGEDGSGLNSEPKGRRPAT